VDVSIAARWRVYINRHVADEVERVLVTQLDASPRFARLTSLRCLRRADLVADASSRHTVPTDEDDSPILRAALQAGVDYLVTNDQHLLNLSPYESLQIISLTDYHNLLQDRGLL